TFCGVGASSVRLRRTPVRTSNAPWNRPEFPSYLCLWLAPATAPAISHLIWQLGINLARPFSNSVFPGPGLMKTIVFFSSIAAILFSSILLLAGCAGVANVSTPSPGGAGSAHGTSAFVYVVSNPGGNNFEINAFSADSNGQLTPVPGSPFAPNVTKMTANRNYLFGTDGRNIDSFSIASNGALTQVSSVNGLQFNPHGGLSDLFFDRTGATLYSVHFLIDNANDGYESYSVDNSTGALTYLGTTFTGCCGDGPLSFIGNNVY